MSELKKLPPAAGVAQFNPSEKDNTQLDVETIDQMVAGDFSIQLNYHTFEQDEPQRGIYIGMTTYTCVGQDTGELKDIEGAVFITAKKKKGGQVVKMTCINCSCKFVDGLKRMPYGFAFEATMTGRKQRGDKSIAQFDIVELTKS